MTALRTEPAAHDTLRIHGFSALQPGPRLMVLLGGVHGDETCGTVGIERAVAELDSGALRLQCGQLTLVPVANPLARRLLRREGERNLNRLFRPDPAGRRTGRATKPASPICYARCSIGTKCCSTCIRSRARAKLSQ